MSALCKKHNLNCLVIHPEGERCSWQDEPCTCDDKGFHLPLPPKNTTPKPTPDQHLLKFIIEAAEASTLKVKVIGYRNAYCDDIESSTWVSVIDAKGFIESLKKHLT